MTKIKTKISEFRKICDLVSLIGKDTKGKQILAIPEFLIDASQNAVKIKAVDKGNHLAIDLTYNVEVLESGPIVIGDVGYIQDFLNRFGSSDEVTIATTENKIIITRESPKKVARIPLASEESLDKKDAKGFLEHFKKNDKGFYETSKTNFNIKLTVLASKIKDVIDDGEAVQQRVYPWSIVDNKLVVKVGAEQSGIIETDIGFEDSTITKDTKVISAYAYGLDNIFNNLSDKVTLYLSETVEGCPLILEQTTDKYSFKAVLAPVDVA
jgi:hypothetical protein